MGKREFGSYTFGEVQTAGGQTVHFTCGIDDRAKVAGFLAEHVRDVYVPTTGTVDVLHGGYGCYTRYDVTQHKYAGYDGEEGGGGYIEVLEVKNPPNERNGFVILDYRFHEGTVFSEWDSLADALTAYEQFWKKTGRGHRAWQELGCKRFVSCGALAPWFYAVGDQKLVGDYAFPEGLQDDPVYTTGRKFVVCPSSDDMPSIKTCLGTRFLSVDSPSYPSRQQTRWYKRMVHWDDGSVTMLEGENDAPNGGWIRPLEDGELWVTEALHQFRQLLTGKTERFSIKFSDGTQFVGRIIPAKAPPDLKKSGQYYAVMRVVGDKKDRRGVFDFVSSPEFPDAVSFLQSRFSEKGKLIEVLSIRPNLPKGKKWRGVYYGNPGK
ncbi:MAG: hypothetical protein KBD27_01205 [Candidatus Moranbacteria bacterium]|nr:hypothetical protein [Candidatus Moranbacteria bacterium]